MKRTLILLLTGLRLATGGEIADYYYQQPHTNLLGMRAFLGPAPVPINHGITEIGIERTGCFGSCPVYVFTVRSNGVARYHGEAHVEKLGDWTAVVDTYQFHRLANFIVQSQYSQMHDTFECGVTDGDTVYTTFVQNGKRKVFRNYASQGPPKLWALQNLIDGVAAGAPWRPASLSESGGPTTVAPLNESVQRRASRSAQATNQTPSAARSRR